MNKLVLVRHGESEWNARGVCTGLADVALTALGIQEAHKTAELLRDIVFDTAHTSMLRRAQETLVVIKHVLDRGDLPVYFDAALNERDYGELTGENKQEMRKKYGKEQFFKWRRGWDHPVPGGKTLRDVYKIIVPYYEKYILPDLAKGKNILVVAHNNSLRALIKYLENISDQDIVGVDLATGEAYVYEVDLYGKIMNREVRRAEHAVSTQKEKQITGVSSANPISAYRQIDIR
jgi:2,3-bisphosphoglycerate-dependent phosphoglycerate mutase